MLKCVILAAGRGSRLGDGPQGKPLCRVHGRALIDWVVLSARLAGIQDFVVITGYGREALERHLRALARQTGIRVSFAYNDEWQRENGISASQAQPFAGDRFVLLMADHVFDPEILVRLTAQPLAPGDLLLAADFGIRHHPNVDLDDVTRILADNGRISRIGKGLESYNAFDTGIFFCTSALFEALAESQGLGDASLSGGVRVLAARGSARVMETGGRYWVDVDDEDGRARAERVLTDAAPLDIAEDAGAAAAIGLGR